MSIARSLLEHLRDRPAMRRTVTIAVIVGALLTLINQGDRITEGEIDRTAALRIAANFLIPWCVSSLGYVSARRSAAHRGGTHPIG